MFRNIPFRFKDHMDKGRDFWEKAMELSMEAGNPLSRVAGAFTSFRVDVLDLDAQYEVYAELPGFEKSDIKVSYGGGRLTIYAERPEVDMGIKYICRERRDGVFERSFEVDDIVEDGVRVSYDDGLLRVVLPKKEKVDDQKVFDID